MSCKTHCCVLHGCKYGRKNCPVVLGTEKQECVCEYCEMDGIQNLTDLNNVILWKTLVRRVKKSDLSATELSDRLFGCVCLDELREMCENGLQELNQICSTPPQYFYRLGKLLRILDGR